MTSVLNSFQNNAHICDVTLLSGDQKIWPNIEGLQPSMEVADAFLVALGEGNLNIIEGGEMPLQIPSAHVLPNSQAPATLSNLTPTISAAIFSTSVPVALTPVGAESVSIMSKPDNLIHTVDANDTDLHSTKSARHQPISATLPVGQITQSDPPLPINSTPLPTTENTTQDPVGLTGQLTRPALQQQGATSEAETSRTPPNQVRHPDHILSNGTATPVNTVALYEKIETTSVLSSTKQPDSQPTKTIPKLPVQGASDEPIGAHFSNFSSPHRSSIQPSQPVLSRQDLSNSHTGNSETVRPQSREHIATQRQVPLTKFGTREASRISNELTTSLKGHASHSDIEAPKAAPNNVVPQAAELPKNSPSLAASNFSRNGHLNPNSVPSTSASEALGGAQDQSSIEPGALLRTTSPSVPPAPISTSLSSPSPPAIPPQLPGHISAQICSALSANQGQEIEISLNPEELGRVRIVLSTKEGGMSVMVFSEKPDVLDLMRRHSDLLEMDFTDIGYQGASFTFQQEQEGNQPPPELPGMNTPHDIAPTQQQYETVDDGRLDLRL